MVKTKRPAKTSPSADLVAAIIFGAVGVALIVIGASTWHPLIFIGAFLGIIALLLSGLMP